ncbi:MAG: squalene/phytoene synthase family protein [Roseicyclus sp.]|uniref:squalene/phytoene synthase family protein n=1 Tax=Roseicyclus sp. TaxID=1914329 RepID=UPI003A8C430D
MVPERDSRRVLFLSRGLQGFCLPDVRDPALALYAFCRVADDEVDFGTNKPCRGSGAARQARVWPMRAAPGMRPPTAPLPRLIEDFDMPRELPEALLEGLAWDGMERRYASLSRCAQLFGPRRLGGGGDDVRLDARARPQRAGACL